MRKVYAAYNSTALGARTVHSPSQVHNGVAVSYGMLAPGNFAWVYESDIVSGRPGSKVWWTNPFTQKAFVVQNGRITDPHAWFEGSPRPDPAVESPYGPVPEAAAPVAPAEDREPELARMDAVGVVDELLGVNGIGEATAKKLAAKGITVDDLKGLGVEELRALGVPAVSAGKVHAALNS